MSEKTSTTTDTTILDQDQLTRFIDPYSDFGFKHLFGKALNRDLLIKFLNGVFKGRKVIVDIQYKNTEYKGPGKKYRKTIFDLYCTGDKGENFIIEMQKAKVQNFIDRSIFYTTNLIQEQGVDVDADWDYLLPEIYFLAIMDFKFDDSHPDHFIHDVRLIEIHTNKEFFPKLSYIFIEMPKFKKTETELENELEEWLYILNNLKQFEEIPVSLREKEEYKKVFEIAEIGNLTPEEMNEYQQSLKIQRDNNATLRYAEKEARAKGLAEGEHKKAVEMALKLLTKGTALDEIADLTGLTIKEIEEL
ncbi:Rpn family recombination-promoting nuclease/putative transposase [Pedobacter heparinus]|uniref:Rpn family recombination-promoting nuclease/putative transposase n=1 Tax=Pedobacter heparinus TaxID=984 RepID=UPI00292F073B|nr:Rpn family recombination-promoting nuclease/putative transposase [Pedobacter heparinus]